MISRISAAFSWLALFLSIQSCGGGSSSETAGTRLTLNVLHRQTVVSDAAASVPAGSRTFSNAEGVSLTLDKAYLVQWSVELKADCSGSPFALRGRDVLEFFFPSANAHALEAPTRLSVPHIIDLTAADNTPVALGEISPPPGDYCGLQIELFPADEDTVGLPADVDMLGKTLYLQGSYSLADGEPRAFKLVSDKKLAEKGLLFADNILSFDNDRLSAVKRITLYYDQWFDGVDFEQLDQPQTTDLILSNIRRSLQVD